MLSLPYPFPILTLQEYLYFLPQCRPLRWFLNAVLRAPQLCIQNPERYSGRKIGTTISPEKFLMKPKSQNIIKDLDNGYTIREIMEMRKCSPSLVSKVKKLRIEVNELQEV
jgi:hypothetical protein